MTVQESYIDVVTDRGEIFCWTRDTEGNLHKYAAGVSDYSYLFLPDNTGKPPEYFNIYGVPMRKVFFENVYEMRKYAKNTAGCHESDVNVIYKYLVDEHSETLADSPVNIGFYDIEVDYDLDEELGYPSPSNPFGKINAISIFDTKNQCYWELMLTGAEIKLTDKEFPVESLFYQSERELLEDFADIIEHMDVIAGWNVNFFDLPYIMERLILNFGEKRAKTMLCRDGFSARKNDVTNDFGEEVWKWELVGRQHLDMMDLYGKFIPKELESKSLDNVCRDELGEEKLEYQGDLGNLYRTNPQKFFEYSLHDSRLLMFLDKKLDLIKTAMTMARTNCVLPVDVTGTIKTVETAFLKFCRKKGNIVLPDKEHSDKEQFAGAIVYDTLPGLYKWGFTVDLTALYPSVMIMLGLSKETVVMQCLKGDADFHDIVEANDAEISVRMEDTETVEKFTAKELNRMIKEKGYTISAAGTIFTGELGLLAEFVQEIFSTRKRYKKLMFEASKAGNEIDRIKYNLLQSVTKILANSCYGAISNFAFRLYDIRLAKSITLTGQVISKIQAYNTNRIQNRIAGELTNG